jgi:hypothetical protein
MVKIVAQPRAWWPVTFKGVTEDGEVVENGFDMRFLLHSEDEHAEIIAEAGRLPERAQARFEELERADASLSDDERAERKRTILSTLYAEFVQRLSIDWRKVEAENGDPLKFDLEHIRQLMNMPGAFKATVAAYGQCRLGEKDIRAGN